MTYDDAFLESILAAPGDDTPRLVYADWLQEHGQECRAEFIRVQCEAARLTVHVRKKHRHRCPVYQARQARLMARARELLPAAAEQDWAGFVNAGVFVQEARWHRGFVEEIDGRADQWLRHAEAILRLAPLLRVRLTTRPPVEYAGEPPLATTVRIVGTRMETRPEYFWDDGAPDRDVPTEVILDLLRKQWPGIAFEVPGFVEWRRQSPSAADVLLGFDPAFMNLNMQAGRTDQAPR